MKNQPKARIADIILQYPAVAAVYAFHTSASDEIKTSLTLFVQQADGELMLEERRPRSEVWRSSKTDCDGVRFEDILPINSANELVGSDHDPNKPILSLKNLFATCPEKKVNYVLWVRRYIWKDSQAEKVDKELEIVIIIRPKDKTWKQLIDEGLKAKEEKETAYLRPPAYTPTLTGLHKAIKKGGKLHAFRSGGGTRVVRIELNGELIAYGESVTLEDAFRRANDNYLKIKPKKTDPDYMTGQSLAASNIDLITLRGLNLDIDYDQKNGMYRASFKDHLHHEVPKDVQEKAEKQPNVPVCYVSKRGYTYKVTYVPNLFANGEASTSTECTTKVKGHVPLNAYYYYLLKQGCGHDVWEALQMAITEYGVEVDND